MNILITGASRGLGFELALRFAELGDHSIVAISRNEAGLKELKNGCIRKNMKAHLYPIAFDLEMVEKYEEELLPKIALLIPHIDIIINNAGLLINKPFESISLAETERMLRVNFLAPAQLSRLLLPFLRKSNTPHILNISSMGGFQGSQKFPGLSIYSSTKGALAVLTECLAEELMEFNISVNCLALGSMNTPMLNEAFPGYKSPVSAPSMAQWIADFALTGSGLFNGKIIPVAITTP
ncbi:MAG TPA: SDR family oxidoreductase [Williamwhitmania sp.]|nr:SDR family oxidoreductase [Williamwhitmania sp.]